MRKIISFCHISLDGFVAGPNGEMDWININDEIFAHVEKRIGKTDAALYGRNTFQLMESYWPTAADKPDASRHDKVHSKWYAGAEKIVLSNTLKESDFTNTKIISGNLAASIGEIKKGPGEEILVFGSPGATHSLMQENLIDGYWLLLNPVIHGKGIPLFKNIQAKTKLKLLTSRQFECGVTELNYIADSK